MHVSQAISQQVSQQLPPTWRDFQVYRLVKIEQRSTRGAAREMRLSQTRVCQIVSRVAEYLMANTPGTDDEEQQRRQLRLAQQIAAERMDFLQRQAVQGFDRSVEMIEVKNKRMTSSGDPRFLYLAARLALMAAKLPAPCLNDVVFAAELDAEDEAAWEEGSDHADNADDYANPPEEDCSPAAKFATVRQPKNAATNKAKPLPPESSITGVSVDLLDKLQHQRTVQPPASNSSATTKQSQRQRRAAFLQGS